MKLQPYVQKLNSSEKYKEFIQTNKDAYLVAGFFVLDFDSGNNVHQIDFFVPSTKRVAAFTLDKDVVMQSLELMNSKTPEKLEVKVKTDLDELKGILEDEMKNRNISEEIKKIIAILQTIEGKKIWNLNCVLTGMEILRAHVEDDSKTVLKMDKSSILDYVKHIPASQLQQFQKKPKTKEEVSEEIKKLDDLEKQIEKQKEEIKGSLK